MRLLALPSVHFVAGKKVFNIKLLFVAPLLATVISCFDAVSQAQVTEVVWGGTTGIRTWQDSGNWIGGVFPNDSSKIANLSVNLDANLTVSFGASDIAVAGVKLGGTSAAVTASISSSGGRLVFNSAAAPTVESTGVAGSVNVIDAPIHLVNQQLEIDGPTNLTINGNTTFEGGPSPAGASNAAINVISPGLTATGNGSITIANSDGSTGVDFRINNHPEAQGTFVINGLILGVGDLQIGTFDPNSLLPLGTVQLANANTFAGNIRAGRGNLILGHDDSLGSATYRHDTSGTQFGYNLIADEDRVISNDIVLAQWQTTKGEHSVEFEGDLTQTRNRGIINLLPAGENVTLSGRLNIWDDEEEIERRFVVDGSGRTIMSGTIRNDPLDVSTIGDLRLITKTGTGVLLVDVGPGDNNHKGPEVVVMGNQHYANNDSLNIFSNARIRALGGAVGVDDHPVGQNLATNTMFLNQIDPTSVGGLMLSATEDAATNLVFTSGFLVNAANMSVAAPETGITYTGTITPANNTYKLGGGTGALTLPNAQLTGARSLLVKNGGTVRLLGDNTYTGATTVNTKYTTSRQEQAAADEVSDAESIFFDRLVAPILEVDDLANGGSPSSIGSSSNAASNLKLQGSTLRYIGTGDLTDRLFTLGTGGGTLDSSGTGAVVFSNTGALAIPDVTDRIGTLDNFTANPTEIINVSDTSDIIVGMTVSDPDPGGPVAQSCGGGTTRNCIPAGTTVTGISDDGKIIGLSASFGFIWKMDTRLVFGAVPRILTLTGSNTQDNTLNPVISNSALGGVVNIVKQGAGTWLLEGMNTTTGVTTVEAGTLGGNGGVGGNLIVEGGATFAPGGTGGSAIGDFSVGGNFSLSSGGVLEIEIGGAAATSQYDVLEVNGTTFLDGELRLELVDEFTPSSAFSFTILTGSTSLFGSFSNVGNGQRVNTAGGSGSFVVNYGLGSAFDPNQVILSAFLPGLPGDFDHDDDVDGLDFLKWQRGESPNPGSPADLADWETYYGTQNSPPLATAIAVPEPATLPLALAALCLGMGRRRSQRMNWGSLNP